jgi:hypothetical protein
VGPHALKSINPGCKAVRLTAKDVARADNGITIIARPQAKGGFHVLAVRVNGLVGTPLGRAYTVAVEFRSLVPAAVKDVARWVSKMGFICGWPTPRATADRDRAHPAEMWERAMGTS